MPASISRSRLRVALPIPAFKLFVGVVFFAMAGCTDAHRPVVKRATVSHAKEAVPSGEVFVRAQYPYSVVVGGVYNPDELARARRTDRVVREHYEGFGDRPEFRRVEKDLLVYVSYRKRDRVFWTRKRHMVRRGELVLAAGDRLARARCGNQLSEKPKGPVESDGPDEEVLGTPEIPKILQALSGTNAPELPEVSAYVPADGFSDLPKVAAPVKGGSIEVPVGGPSTGSGGLPSFPNAFARTISTPATTESSATTPGVTGQPVPPGQTTGGGGGNAPPTGTPTEGVPTFEPPFVPPRPPLAPVPEPNIPKSMWVVLLAGLACLRIRKSAGTR